MKCDKKHLYKDTNKKRIAQEILHSFLDVGENTVTKDQEKAEVLKDIFASVFNRKTDYPQGNQPPELVDWDGEQMYHL